MASRAALIHRDRETQTVTGDSVTVDSAPNRATRRELARHGNADVPLVRRGYEGTAVERVRILRDRAYLARARSIDDSYRPGAR